MTATINPTRIDLMGAAEVAEVLGVGKSRVTELRTTGVLPTPVAELRSGPIWDREAIEEFAKSRKLDGPVRAIKHRYVEVAYRLPGDKTVQFMGVLAQTTTPDDAFEEAVAEVRRQHPKARDITEFLQRTITGRKAKAIRARFEDGTWEGWDFGA